MQTDEIKIKITDTTRNAEATLKLETKNEKIEKSEILKLITNKTFKISVFSEYITEYQVYYEIKSKSLNESSFKILINYPNI